jgi:hypothetical protein
MRQVLPLVLVMALVVGCDSDRSDERSRRDEQPASTYDLESENVPENLRHLAPLAEKWGIGDDVERAQLVERASPADREALIRAITPHQSEITAWLDSFGMDPMSDEAAAFMYMQLAVEEMSY